VPVRFDMDVHVDRGQGGKVQVSGHR
jgi:hypothetical protein